jgi:hypothetical protein
MLQNFQDSVQMLGGMGSKLEMEKNAQELGFDDVGGHEQLTKNITQALILIL